jgi:hypothetical protein
MVGAQERDVGPVFPEHHLVVGLPRSLAEMTLKIGSLGMLAIGLCYLAAVGRARRQAFPVMSASRSGCAHTA